MKGQLPVIICRKRPGQRLIVGAQIGIFCHFCGVELQLTEFGRGLKAKHPDAVYSCTECTLLAASQTDVEVGADSNQKMNWENASPAALELRDLLKRKAK